MTRRLHNWTYSDVTGFLKEHGFKFFEPLKGSHESWVKLGENGEPDEFVELNFRRDTFPVGTMKQIIKESRIDEKLWIKWARS